MTTDEIRKRFLCFFKSKGHSIISSDSLVPKNDPSVLFTSAGMNQFKAQFLGKVADFKMVATSQKCLRTGDLEKVGHTPWHHTFFEMLGNFSFGDYFKKEAISWAWEFLTKDLKINSEKLLVSVYEKDSEAYRIWLNDVGVSKDKIYKFDQKENFWPSNAIKDGPNGPCGPCSEIFFDWGKDVGCGRVDCSPVCDCGRFVEIWNLVFTQFDRKDGGNLEDLPTQNIDTGMGLERMASCMQGVKTNFEIDILRPIVDETRNILGIKPGKFTGNVNCIIDHIRAVVFAIGDGVLPSNVSRGYVIRKLIRRASWFAQEIGFKKPLLYKLVSCVCDLMKEPYPELLGRRENIASIILSEEERFMKSLKEGGSFYDQAIADLKSKNMNTIPGEIIFKLYDTYGFPYEQTSTNAKLSGMKLDLAGFDREMAKQKEKARNASNIAGDIFSKDILEILPSEFVGYEATSSEAQIIQIIQAKQNVESLKEGQEGWVILDKTPFYGESGGQIGDIGKIISSNNKSKLEALDTKQIDNSIVHIVKVIKGEFKVGDKVVAEIDNQRREAIKRSHTATHLLQASLRRVLGQHVQQSGSLVEPDRLRFDFTHFKAVKDEELDRIQDLINEYIKSNDKVRVEVLDKDKALKSGAIALFGEKYDQKVRVISVGDYSKEFCGGTHLDNTGSIALARIDSERSIGSGLRRIELYTGKLAREHERLRDSAKKIQEKKEASSKKKKILEKKIADSIRDKLTSKIIPDIVKNSQQIKGSYFVAEMLRDLDVDMLRVASDLAMNLLSKKAVVFLASDRGQFVVRASKDLKEKISASEILGQILKPFGGSGGGRPNFAQGGIKNKQKMAEIVKKAKEVIKKELSR